MSIAELLQLSEFPARLRKTRWKNTVPVESVYGRRASKRARGDGSSLKSYNLQYVIELLWKEEYYHEKNLDQSQRGNKRGVGLCG